MNSSKQIKLLPCPFCGSEGVHTTYWRQPAAYCYAIPECPIFGEVMSAEAWNTRTATILPDPVCLSGGNSLKGTAMPIPCESEAGTNFLDQCPKCGGKADNGHDRCLPPSAYYCVKCMGDVAKLVNAPAVATDQEHVGSTPTVPTNMYTKTPKSIYISETCIENMGNAQVLMDRGAVTDNSACTPFPTKCQKHAFGHGNNDEERNTDIWFSDWFSNYPACAPTTALHAYDDDSIRLPNEAPAIDCVPDTPDECAGMTCCENSRFGDGHVCMKKPIPDMATPQDDKYIISEMLMAFIDGFHGKKHENYACGEKDENGMRNVLALLIEKGWTNKAPYTASAKSAEQDISTARPLPGEPFLHNRADGVNGHYSIARIKADGVTHEYWARHGWGTFGDCFRLGNKGKKVIGGDE